MAKKATAAVDDSAMAEVKPLDAGLLRIQEANREVDERREEYLEAKQKAKDLKGLLEGAVEHLREVIRQETEPLPLFDGLDQPEEDA